MKEIGLEAFRMSQDRVPVQTGYLKASGSYNSLKGGFLIEYTADYAEKVEYGNEDQAPVQTEYVQNVRAHKRVLSSGKAVMVKSHRKKFGAGLKPTFVNGKWRTFDSNRVIVGRRFLSSSIEDALEQNLTDARWLKRNI